jgi:hypothetical protein
MAGLADALRVCIEAVVADAGALRRETRVRGTRGADVVRVAGCAVRSAGGAGSAAVHHDAVLACAGALAEDYVRSFARQALIGSSSRTGGAREVAQHALRSVRVSVVACVAGALAVRLQGRVRSASRAAVVCRSDTVSAGWMASCALS